MPAPPVFFAAAKPTILWVPQLHIAGGSTPLPPPVQQKPPPGVFYFRIAHSSGTDPTIFQRRLLVPAPSTIHVLEFSSAGIGRRP
ncbi:hypothetical protein PM082_019788 [Marasmius tenuissimus]|nr:hypothetical protein PM082_019788 [Marasmius tenuissimus]